MFRLIQAPTHATEGTDSYCLSDPFASPCGHQMGQAGGPAIFLHISSTAKREGGDSPHPPPLCLFW